MIIYNAFNKYGGEMNKKSCGKSILFTQLRRVLFWFISFRCNCHIPMICSHVLVLGMKKVKDEIIL